jgi:hypothetical protein
MELLNKSKYLANKKVKIGTQQITLSSGKTVECELSISWDYDEVDDFKDLDTELQQKIEKNEISCMVIVVTASFGSIECSHYLGGCLVDKPLKIAEIVETFGIDGDLIPDSIEELKNELNELISKLT